MYSGVWNSSLRGARGAEPSHEHLEHTTKVPTQPPNSGPHRGTVWLTSQGEHRSPESNRVGYNRIGKEIQQVVLKTTLDVIPRRAPGVPIDRYSPIHLGSERMTRNGAFSSFLVFYAIPSISRGPRLSCCGSCGIYVTAMSGSGGSFPHF